MKATADIAQKISRSKIFEDYQRAFGEATGLPVNFQPVGRKALAFRKNKFANAFCLKLVENDPGCRLCLAMQEKLGCDNSDESHSATCRAGLTDTTVPVMLGEQIIGHLQTGQVALKKLTGDNFKKLAKWLLDGGAKADWPALEKAYFKSPQLSQKQYSGMVHLLEVFAEHLAHAAEQIATQQENNEPPMIQRARKFIADHTEEDISIHHVAKVVNTSTFYFCKMFKKTTGLTFTEYLSLVRVAKAKELLINPNLRISEIAFEVGFKSLTHFNRVFREITGTTPTAYRDSLPKFA